METSAKDSESRKYLSRQQFLKLGIGAGLSAGLAIGTGCAGRPGRNRPNIVLIVLDTTRADRLSCYGYDRPTTPNLDLLAAESILYTDAISSSSWTLPAHATLFTGKFVTSHGARFDPEGPLILADGIEGPDTWKQYRARGLAKDEMTLAGILKEAGYLTGAVVGGPWMKKVFGLHSGFDHYDDDEITSLPGRQADEITSRALKWVEETQDGPFFLFLNYFDPHTPYEIHEEFNHLFLPPGTDLSRREEIPEQERSKVSSGLYDAEIRYMDHHIGVFLDGLKELDLYDGTWIIVTADHGELLGEHGMRGHGYWVTQEEIHVPLFAKYPGTEIAPARTDSRVQLTDIMPMILERLDIAKPRDIQGSSPSKIDHPILAEVYPLTYFFQAGHTQAIFDGNYKFVHNSKNNHQLFDLERDPREMDNLVARELDRARNMQSKLVAYLASLPKHAPPGEQQIVDKETQRALKSLGYTGKAKQPSNPQD
jgi:arylsulfatase A-like enzyme